MRITDTGAEITKLEARALLAHASKDETREHLASIHVDPARGAVVATDGHRLALCNGAEPSACFAFSVPREAIERAQKASKPASMVRLTLRSDGRVDVAVDLPNSTLTETIAATEANDGRQFPPYQQIVPDRSAVQPATTALGFNAKYFGDMALCAVAAGLDKTTGVQFLGSVPQDKNPELAPMLFTSTGPEGTWSIVVMPMRI